MDNARIAILLATYNGERYLREQMDSLFRQSYTDWTLYVHDDGSTDKTMEIVKEYAQTYSNVHILDYDSTHGACANFLSMLKAVDADYYFFCDQDDVWDEDKVRVSLDAMRQAEKRNPEKSIVVHSDLYVVDENLDIIDTSFMRYVGIYPEYLTRLDECVIPFVTGCTMMLNSAAKQLAQRPSEKALMHDMWLTLCVLSSGGEVVCIPKPTVYYRQHGKNTLGARDINIVTWRYRIRNLLNILHNKREYYSMLKSVGYGSPLKYLYYKYLYRKRTKKRKMRLETK